MRAFHTARLADGLGGCRVVDVPRHDGRAFEAVDAAPVGEPVQIKVRDAIGDYILPFGCAFDGERWINADLGTALGAGVTVIGWRRRDFR